MSAFQRKKHSKAKPVSINLLPKDAFSQSGVGKFLDWALTTGRYIVIFTEMVVILTFLQRFTLDRKLSDLNEDIFEREAVLESYHNVETEVRRLQSKAIFLQELEDQVDILSVLDFLNNNSPQDVTFDRLNVAREQFNLEGISYSQNSLESFIEILKLYEGVTDVSLDKIARSENSSGINFKLRVDFSDPQG